MGPLAAQNAAVLKINTNKKGRVRPDIISVTIVGWFILLELELSLNVLMYPWINGSMRSIWLLPPARVYLRFNFQKK